MLEFPLGIICVLATCWNRVRRPKFASPLTFAHEKQRHRLNAYFQTTSDLHPRQEIQDQDFS